mmetsp:Transcript_52781/g.84095  ORF Transcript_52781/g.84095 Transcript_52781/m.84095 type:complete len:278 (-) Transcript_52781:774-1607(-)
MRLICGQIAAFRSIHQPHFHGIHRRSDMAQCQIVFIRHGGRRAALRQTVSLLHRRIRQDDSQKLGQMRRKRSCARQRKPHSVKADLLGDRAPNIFIIKRVSFALSDLLRRRLLRRLNKPLLDAAKLGHLQRKLLVRFAEHSRHSDQYGRTHVFPVLPNPANIALVIRCLGALRRDKRHSTCFENMRQRQIRTVDVIWSGLRRSSRRSHRSCERLMRQYHAFGVAGGARRVHDVGHVILARQVLASKLLLHCIAFLHQLRESKQLHVKLLFGSLAVFV